MKLYNTDIWKTDHPKKTKLSVLVVLVVAFVLFFLLYSVRKPETVRVSLSWLNQAQFAGMYVAEANGFYRDEGIKVHLMERDFGGSSRISLLKEGRADIAIMSASNFFNAVSNGEDIVALAAVFQISPTVIASLKQKNIKSPRDLVGKKLGLVKMNEESKLLSHALLKESGISVNSILYKEVGNNQVDALLRGDVDAISIYRINELYELNKQKIPYNLIFPERFGVDIYGDIIVARKDYLQSHKKEIGGFLRATFKGWEFAEKDPNEAIRITLEVDNQRYHDALYEEYILKNALEMVRLYPKQALGQMIPAQWSYMYELFKEHGLVGYVEIKNFIIDFETYEELGFPEY